MPAGRVFEQVGATDVRAHGPRILMSRHVHDPAFAHVVVSSRCDEARAQAVPREFSSVIAGGVRIAFHDTRDGVRCQAHVATHLAAAADRPKDRTICDLRGVKPRAQRFDGLERTSMRNGDFLSLRFLIGLGAADRYAKPVGHERQVRHVQRGKFAATECASESEREQSAVAQARQRARRMRQHGGQDIGGRRRFLFGLRTDGSANAAQHAANGFVLRRIIHAGGPMRVANRGGAAGDGRSLGAGRGVGGEEGRDQVWTRRQGLLDFARLAPCVEGGGVGFVRPDRRRRLFGEGEGPGEVEIGGESRGGVEKGR